jgi:alkylated DNA nucleotide flippase Atl1
MRMPKKTEMVLEVLKDCAKQRRTITYGELAKLTSLDRRGLGRPLGYIRDEVCRPEDLPWLNSLAVKKGVGHQGRPAHAFIPSDMTGGTPADQEAFWQTMVERSFSYAWDNVTL